MVDSNHETEIRCHHCAGSLTKNLETSEWTVSPFIRDSFSMVSFV
ncbi:BnaA03g06970D [Brassica napus]|uniref:BnaA03g06970D protein n=1 Tax=Brassica napus TaxID=3708 RepID=A0A078IMM9_BRANA|nr:BnaA03g06970D [Brassica napus]